MIIGGRRAFFLLFAGDIAAFSVSLYLTLGLRYWEIPDIEMLSPYILPFILLFVFWALVFYSVGLYSKQFLLFPSRLPDALFKTQIANILFAALFFFVIPIFGIAPKTILALYLVVSLVLVFFWRLTLFPLLPLRRERERAVLDAVGKESDELFTEVNGNPRYGIEFFSRDIGTSAQASIIVVDHLWIDSSATRILAREGKQVISFEDMYEEVFDRIPLSQLGTTWFRENVASADPLLYIIGKRCIDLAGGLLMGLVTLLVAPFIFVCNHLEGTGPLFIKQERFGRHGARITVYKFRSMQKNIAASGQWTHEHKDENKVTRVGAFLRRTSLDEFPQFVNILRGEISLVGPRNDILGLGERLAHALPYYETRYAVTPGITGWAQINQQYEPGNVSPQSIEETKVRLAYDFYYLKHRSLGMDIIIAVKTFKRMFFRVSSW